jgi:hypothetical protein
MMGTKKPRVNVMLDEDIYRAIKTLSEEERISMSSLMRDLIKEALELREDSALAKFAEKREKTLNKKKMLSHKDVWG